jgi:hypothetical protein|nr:MAG TPA: hypothetical protein [Caudoviricetes sp.]
MYNVKREKIETIWRPTIFSNVTHTINACLFILYKRKDIMSRKTTKKYWELL